MARHFRRTRWFGTRVLGIHPEFSRGFSDRDMETLPTGLDPFSGNLYANFTKLSLPKLLHYEDRNSMAFSIEARVPFLDYRLVKFTIRLPDHQKIHRGVTKVILRNALREYCPKRSAHASTKWGL